MKGQWATAAEIRHRLIQGGVDHALSEEHVVAAKRYQDRHDIFLCRRRDRTVSYYRSTEWENKCPDDQRWKDSGLPVRTVAQSILLPDGYFRDIPEASHHLTELNDALIKLDCILPKKKRESSDDNLTPATPTPAATATTTASGATNQGAQTSDPSVPVTGAGSEQFRLPAEIGNPTPATKATPTPATTALGATKEVAPTNDPSV